MLDKIERERHFSGNEDINIGSVREGEQSGVTLLDLLLILLDRKWFLLGGAVLLSAASVVLVLLMTSYYTATVVVLPSQQKMGLPLGSLMGDLPMGGLMKSLDFLGSDDNSRFMSILESRN